MDTQPTFTPTRPAADWMTAFIDTQAWRFVTYAAQVPDALDVEGVDPMTLAHVITAFIEHLVEALNSLPGVPLTDERVLTPYVATPDDMEPN